jgi:hypothetical protein
MYLTHPDWPFEIASPAEKANGFSPTPFGGGHDRPAAVVHFFDNPGNRCSKFPAGAGTGNSHRP